MRKLIVVAAAGAVFAVAGPAGAANWTVFAGPPTKAPKSVPANADFDNFYPSLLRVNAGDSITFATAGFHTVTFLGRTTRDDFLQVVSTPRKYPTLRDAAGMPWWWHGETKFEYGTRWMLPTGSSTIAGHDELHNAVISPLVKRPRVTYAFSNPGVYRYVCLLHPFMDGVVIVKPAGETVPGAPTVLQAAGRRLGNDWAAAAKRAKVAPTAPNTVYMGVGTSRTSVNSFLPARLTIKVGQAVRFINRSPAEVHDVAFGPAPYLKRLLAKTDFTPRRPNDPRNQVSPFYLFGTDAAPDYVVDGRSHRNGTMIGGVTDYKAGTCLGCSRGIGLPGQTRVTFTQPGVYRYVCLLHAPQMHGVIVVRR